MFRSRLEARYAVLLDALGVRWQFEAEGFDTDAGWYLPDFYLPESDLWIEVKPAHPSALEVDRCRALLEEVRGGVRLLYGPFGWWTMAIGERRAGGVGFWREAEPTGDVHAFADPAHRYAPAVCSDCGAFGVPFRGTPSEVCGLEHARAVASPLDLPALDTATRLAEAHRFDGGR